MTMLEVSISYQRIPCAADVGKAWWLLCHASPKESSDSHARLRDSSPVSKRRRPKKWHSELIEKVTWCRTSNRTAPPHSRPVSAAVKVPPMSHPSPNAAPSPPIAHTRNVRST